VELRHREPIGEVSFSPSGEYIATSSWYEGARIWHADREDDARRLTDETPASSFAFSPDGAHFATAGGETISIRNTESWRPVRRLMHKDQLREVLFSPDSRLVAGVTSSAVQIWELASESQTVNMPVGAEVVRVAFSPDGRFLVTTSRDNVARLWEVSTGGEGSPRVVRLHNPVFVQPGRQIPCYGGKRS
jgi:WD40 repeat protein